MQLDTKKDFATIYGHRSAVYEQGGMLFDGGGRLVGEETARESEVNTPEYDAKEFLKELLEGTPMSRKKVAEVAEQAGIAWFDIEIAAGALNVDRRKKGFGETWVLN